VPDGWIGAGRDCRGLFARSLRRRAKVLVRPRLCQNVPASFGRGKRESKLERKLALGGNDYHPANPIVVISGSFLTRLAEFPRSDTPSAITCLSRFFCKADAELVCGT